MDFCLKFQFIEYFVENPRQYINSSPKYFMMPSLNFIDLHIKLVCQFTNELYLEKLWSVVKVATKYQ